MHRVLVHSRHTPRAKLEKKYPEHEIIDVTSRAPTPWVKFSPFYPHGEIPVPGSPGHVSQSVEGLWQGLKVFETAGVDLAKMQNTTMKRLKRTVRKFGQVKGHLASVDSEELLGYGEARYALYLPAYLWVLENCLVDELDALREIAEERPIVLLDYETNGDVDDLRKPLSHAWLIAHYLNDEWPSR